MGRKLFVSGLFARATCNVDGKNVSMVWWLSKPQTTQLDSIRVKSESKCCPIITLCSLFSSFAVRFFFVFANYDQSLTLSLSRYNACPRQALERPLWVSDSQCLCHNKVVFILDEIPFFCFVRLFWMAIHPFVETDHCVFFFKSILSSFYGQTTHTARRGTASVVKTRKCNNSPTTNWQQLAFAQLPANLLLVFFPQPNNFQTHLR